MNRSMRNLRLLLRAETMLAEHRLGLAGRRAGLLTAAGLVAAFGLVMLDVAAFFALAPSLGEAGAALAVAAANFLIAVLLALTARNTSEAREMAPVREVRDLALADLDETAQDLRADIAAIRGFAARPGEGLTASLLGPIIIGLIRGLLNRGKS